MLNVFVEPKPKGRPEGTTIFHFVLEHLDGSRVTNRTFATQQGAVEEARRLGHVPLVAHVRNTDKARPADWCARSYTGESSWLD